MYLLSKLLRNRKFSSIIATILIVVMTANLCCDASYGFFIDRKSSMYSDSYKTNNSNLIQEQKEVNKSIYEQIEDDIKKYGDKMENEDFSYVSSDGNLLLGKGKNDDGTDKFTVASNEKMIYKENAEKKEGLTYVGTMASTGMDIYKETIYDEEVEEYMNLYSEEIAEMERYDKSILDWAKRDAMTNDEMTEAIKSADEFFEEVAMKYYEIVVATKSAVITTEDKTEYSLLGSVEEIATYSEVDEITDKVASSSELEIETETEPEPEAETEEEIKYTYVKVCDPEPVYDEDLSFISINDDLDDEDTHRGLLGANNNSIGNHTTIATDVLVITKNKIYMTIYGREENGEAKRLNGAAVTLSYKDDAGKIITQNEVSTTMNDRDGMVCFENIDGRYNATINISCIGYRKKTFFTSIIEGGVYYEYTLEKKTDNFEKYLRGIAIDGIDFLDTDYTLYLYDTADRAYDIKYLVDFSDDPSINDAKRNVTMRTVNQKPTDISEEQSKKYRDKKFKATNIERYENHGETYIYTVKAKWTERTNINFVPTNCDGYEDTSSTRFLVGDELYLDLPESLTWEDTKSSTFKTRLKVELAKGESGNNFTINVLGLGHDGEIFNGDTNLPGLKSVSMKSDFLDLPVSLYYSKDGDAVGTFNVSGTLNEWMDDLKSDGDLKKYPCCDNKFKKAKEVFKDAKSKYQNAYDKYKKQSQLSKLNKIATALKTVKAEFNFSAGFIFNYEKKTFDIFGAASAKFTGGITWYHFFGIVPVYGGFEGTGTVEVGFDLGAKDDVGGLKISEKAGFSLSFRFALAIFVGIGIHGVLGAEGNGEAYFRAAKLPAGSSTGMPLPYRVNAGYNVSLKLSLLFVNFDLTFLSKDKVIYPKDDYKYPK